MIGAGGQAPDQIRAVHAVRPLRQLTVADRNPRSAQALADEIGPELGRADFTTATDIKAALADAQIVCCATSATKPLFSGTSLPAEVHVNAIGAFRPGMRELPNDLLANSTVVVDQLEAVLEDSGEIIHALESGALTTEALTELGYALVRPATDRRRGTVFKSVGIAIQDWAVASLLAKKFLR